MIPFMKTKRCGQRDGMALVVVLGLISMLLISGVTFAIMMRVNRAGSANARSAAIARQMTMNALTYAIAAIDGDIQDDAYPYWFDEEDPTAPTWKKSLLSSNDKELRSVSFLVDTLGSIDYGVVPNQYGKVDVAEASIMCHAAEAYLPPGLRPKASAVKWWTPKADKSGSNFPGDYDGHAVSRPEWIGVKAGTGTKGDIVGRHAFLAFNTSGALDFNAIGNPVDPLPDRLKGKRWMGQYAAEIKLPDAYFVDGKNASSITIEDYNDIGEFIADNYDENHSGKNDILSDKSEFSTFSYSPLNIAEKAADLEKGAVVMIGGKSASELKGMQAMITEAFKKSGLDSVQAKWAYLGLLDYVDDGDSAKPNGTTDKERYARPVVKPMPLFNGYQVELTITRRECAAPVTVWNADGSQKKTFQVVGYTNYEYEVSCGKADVVFASREYDSNTSGDAMDMNIEAKMVAWFSGGGLDDDPEDEDEPFAKLNTKVATKKNAFSSCDGVLDFKSDLDKRTATVKMEENKQDHDEADFPQLNLNISCAGKTKDSGRSYPLKAGDYEDGGAGDYWMNSTMEDIRFTDEPKGSGKKAYSQKPAFSASETGGDYELREWTTNIVVWAELVDPSYGDDNMYDNGDFGTAIGNGVYVTNLKSDCEDESSLMYKLRNHNETKDFFTDPSSHHFETGFYKGYSNLQEKMLTTPSVIKECLGGYVDGAYLAGNKCDEFYVEGDTGVMPSVWNNMYGKREPIESVGELGQLPIGPYYSIRLFDHGDADIADFPAADGDSIFVRNVLPDYSDDDTCIFHKVLDYFAASESVSGLVNINTTDTNALAAVFTEMPIETWHGPDGDPSRFGVDFDVDVLVGRFSTARDALYELNEDACFQSISQLGYLFLDSGGSYENEIDGLPTTEAERESIIRNSCGLFTTRGQTFLVIMRGDAFSPQFGMSGIKSGTVHASRMAIAQIWRDNKKDENGNHPCFVRFFKMLEE